MRIFILILFVSTSLPAQWLLQESGSKERLRGVSAVSADVAWASGNHSTCIRTVDGGKKWKTVRVLGADSLDFRDVEAFDANTAYLLSIGPGQSSRIYKTTNAGSSWMQQFVGNDSRIFLDEFAFWDREHGIAVGDEIDGHLYFLKTSDGGKSWVRIPPDRIPKALPGEGAFAASGSGITTLGRSFVWVGTGVKTARLFKSSDRGESWKISATPILNENESSGIFSVAFHDQAHGIVVGGDYRRENDTTKNAALTSDGGMSWSLIVQNPPSGFRSAVIYVTRDFLISVGPAGTDSSMSGGKSWHPMGTEGFHALSRSKDGKGIWAVGEVGRIAKFVMSSLH